MKSLYKTNNMEKNKNKKVEEVTEDVKAPEESVEVAPEEVKPVEAKKPIEAKPVEVKPQRFKNNTGKGMKIKKVEGIKINWMTVKPGDTVTIPAKIAKANNLTRVE